MAYTIPNYMDFAGGSNYQEFVPGTPEYERKKREQELLAQQQGQQPATGPVSPSMLDRFSNNVQQGFENLQQAPSRFAENVQQLPDQFQQGLQNVQSMVRPRSPDEQVQVAGPTQMPQQPSATVPQTPGPQAQDQYSLATGQTGLGIQMPGAQAQPQYNTTELINRYQSIQDNPQDLLKLGFGDEAPDWLKNRAKSRAGEILDSEVKQRQAQEQLKNLNQNDMAKLLTKRSEGNSVGDWLQYLLYKHVGLTDMADQKGAQLGIGKTSLVTGEDGTPYMIKVANNGTPLEGINANTGKPLTQKELISVGAGAGSKLNIVGGSYINDRTGEVGRMVTDEKTGRTYIQTDTGRKPMTGFRPQASTGSLQDMRARQIQELNIKLQGKTLEEKMAILRPYNQQLVGAGYPAISPEEVGITAPQIQAQPVQQAPVQQAPVQQAPVQQAPVQQAPVQQAPVQQAQPAQAAPAAGTVTASALPGGGVKLGKRPTATEIELGKEAGKARIQTQAEGERVILTEAAKQVASSPDTQNMLNGITKVTELIDSGKHNVGSALSGFAGRGPVAQAIGGQFETVDAKNTKLIMDTVNKLAADGLKTLGSNPSTADLEFWTKFKPDASSDPEFVKEWIESRSADLKRRLGYAGTQQQQGGRGGPAAEVPKTSKLTSEDTKALEWARRNPNDPRAKEIKQRLGL